MDRRVFADRLRAALHAVHDYTGTIVIESLPARIVARVVLNASYDGNPLHRDERVYPADRDIDPTTLAACSEEDAIDLLWREGLVPEWINVSIVGITFDATVVELLCCGRFTANEALRYHKKEGISPFHVLGPPLPPRWEEGQRFSLFRTASCRTRDEFAMLGEHARHVWLLRLDADAFGDDDLLSLPTLPSLEILEIAGTRMTGAGLAALARLPSLRIVRLNLRPDCRFDLSALPSLRGLEELSIEGLPTPTQGMDSLAQRLPRVERLRLNAEDTLNVPDSWPHALRDLTIGARRVVRVAPLPARLESISVRLTAATRGEVEALFANVAQARSLNLRGTPVDESFVRDLVSRLKPQFVDLVDTGILGAALQRIPGARVFPRPAEG